MPGVYTVTLQASDGTLTDTATTPITLTPSTSGTLRGYWSLDEASGTRSDGSSYGNHLTETNTVGSTTGQIGLAADLNGTDAYLSIGDAGQNGLAITGSLTLAGWVNVNSLDPSQYLMFAGKYRYGSQPSRGYRLGVTTQGRLHFAISDDGSYSESKNALAGNTTMVTDGTRWYHVAAVFDADAQEMTLYLDGQVDSVKSNLGFNRINLSTAPFMLGADLDGDTPVQHFDGQLDEWRVYAEALSESEIQALLDLPPTAAFDSSSPDTLGQTTSFSNQSTGGNLSFVWDFGDGSPLVTTTPSTG